MNLAADWLKQAERDWAAASAAAGHHEWTAFEAQPCAEKAAKGLVQSVHGEVRGHGIVQILRQLPASVKVTATVLDSSRELDKVYVTSRYPNGFTAGAPSDYFTERSSKELLGHAGQVLEFCRSQIH